MIAGLLAACSRLDRWLHRRLGRPYGIVLTVGLLFEIVHRLAEASQTIGETKRMAALIALVLLNAALLIHQLSELGERVTPEKEGAGEGQRKRPRVAPGPLRKALARLLRRRPAARPAWP